MSLTERIDVIVDNICKDIRENPDNWLYTSQCQVRCLKSIAGSFVNIRLEFKGKDLSCDGNPRVFTGNQKRELWSALVGYIDNKPSSKYQQEFINTYGGN